MAENKVTVDGDQLLALAKEHRPNYVTEGVWSAAPELSTQYTRVKCDGDRCVFYTQDKSWYAALDRHAEHVAEVLRERLAQAWDEGHLDACEDGIDGMCPSMTDHLARNPYRVSTPTA